MPAWILWSLFSSIVSYFYYKVWYLNFFKTFNVIEVRYFMMFVFSNFHLIKWWTDRWYFRKTWQSIWKGFVHWEYGWYRIIRQIYQTLAKKGNVQLHCHACRRMWPLRSDVRPRSLMLMMLVRMIVTVAEKKLLLALSLFENSGNKGMPDPHLQHVWLSFLRIQYHIHNFHLQDPALMWINPVHIFKLYVFEVHCSIFVPSVSRCSSDLVY
jgi:hypothetical protein